MSALTKILASRELWTELFAAYSPGGPNLPKVRTQIGTRNLMIRIFWLRLAVWQGTKPNWGAILHHSRPMRENQTQWWELHRGWAQKYRASFLKKQSSILCSWHSCCVEGCESVGGGFFMTEAANRNMGCSYTKVLVNALSKKGLSKVMRKGEGFLDLGLQKTAVSIFTTEPYLNSTYQSVFGVSGKWVEEAMRKECFKRLVYVIVPRSWEKRNEAPEVANMEFLSQLCSEL